MEVKRNKLVSDSLIYGIGDFSSKFLVYLLLPLYTKYLEPEEYGRIDIFLNILGILYSLASLQSIEVIFRYIQDAKTDNEKHIVISNSFLLAIAGMFIFAAGMLIIKQSTGFTYSYVFIFYTITNIIYQFYRQLVRGLGKTMDYAFAGILATNLQIIANLVMIIILRMKGDALLYSNILMFFGSVTYLVCRTKIWRLIEWKYLDKKIIKNYLQYCIPLIPNAACIWAMSSIGRYLLLLYYGQEQVGLFAFSNKFSLMLTTINSIFFMAWQKSATAYYCDNDRDLFGTKVLNKFTTLQFSSVLIFLPLVKIITFTMIGDAYRIAWPYIPIFFVGVIFNAYANFYSMGFFGAKKTGTIFISSFITLVVYAALGLIMVKQLCIYGVCISYTISQAVYWLIMKIRVKQYMSMLFDIRRLMLFIPLIVAYTALYYAAPLYMQYITLISGAILFIIINRGEINSAVNIVIHRKG